MQEDIDELIESVQRLKAQSQFTLQQLVAQRRIDAGKTTIWTAFPAWAKTWHRDAHMHWCLEKAGVLEYRPQVQHQLNEWTLSRDTHVTFSADWMSKKLLPWYNKSYNNVKKGLGFWDGSSLFPQLTIGVKPKVGAWDKLKSFPIKTVSKILNLLPKYKDHSWLATDEEIAKYRTDWYGSQIYAPEGWEGNKHGTIAWVHFDTKLILAIVYIDEWFFKAVAQYLTKHSNKSRYKNLEAKERGTCDKGKGDKGKGTSNEPDGGYHTDPKGDHHIGQGKGDAQNARGPQ